MSRDNKKKQYKFLHLIIFLAQIHLDSRYWLSHETKCESDSRIHAGFTSLRCDKGAEIEIFLPGNEVYKVIKLQRLKFSRQKMMSTK